MRNISLIVFAYFILFLLLTACSVGEETDTDSLYTYTIALNGKVYGFTDEVIPSEKIGKKIGEGIRIISGTIVQNGDISCGQRDCKAPPGTKFYLIRNVSIDKAIAVIIEDGSGELYLKCVWIKTL